MTIRNFIAGLVPSRTSEPLETTPSPNLTLLYGQLPLVRVDGTPCLESRRKRFIAFRHAAALPDDRWRTKIMPRVSAVVGMNELLRVQGTEESAETYVEVALALAFDLAREMAKSRRWSRHTLTGWQVHHVLIAKRAAHQLGANGVAAVRLDPAEIPANADPNDEWLIVAKGDSQLGSLFGEEKKGRVWNALDRSAGLINDACMFRRENKIYLNKTKLFVGAPISLPGPWN